MDQIAQNGEHRLIDGVDRVYYDGYWIKYYQPPAGSLNDKKNLIQSLTRRLFNHMEHGINIPGHLLDKVRAAYEAEQDPHKKRVKGAMLAGALFNRAADIFNQLVELEACGVKIESGNELRKVCGDCLQEALQLGKLVRHRNGDEGIDELWGEPFRAFAMSIKDFYQSRYIKIALTMRNIDQVTDYMVGCIKNDHRYAGLKPLLQNYAEKAKTKCETLRTDENIFDVWSDFVVAGEAVTEFKPVADETDESERVNTLDRQQMLEKGVKLISHITRARTSMPKSTQDYFVQCQSLQSRNC
jgi:hypothetical protein